MPYFQRKPIEGLVDSLRSQFPIPGLPSRGASLPAAVAAGIRPDNPLTGITGIVEQATAVLGSERPSLSPLSGARPDAGPVASTQSTQVSQLQQQVNALIEQVVALAGRPYVAQTATPYTRSSGQQPDYGTAECVVEPAPVFSPPEAVAPGGTAQIKISLSNEDEQPAQIVFLSTGLVGEGGEQIPVERVSFHPREVTLQPGATGEVMVRVAVSPQTRCGIYSGLIRASRLDYLHAVVVVQVEESQI